MLKKIFHAQLTNAYLTNAHQGGIITSLMRVLLHPSKYSCQAFLHE